MNGSRRLVRVLLWLYPASWRREYGAELQELLLAQPISAAAVGDVLWNALRQRVRSTDPAMLLGLMMMTVVTTGLVLNVVSPPRSGIEFSAVLRPSAVTWPRVIVFPLDASGPGVVLSGSVVRAVAPAVYVLILLGCGCWTHLRHGGRLSRAAMAGVKMTFVGGIPVMLIGLLMMVGLVDVRGLAPPQLATTIENQRLTYTYFSGETGPGFAFAVLTAPLFALPVSALWGAVGGQLGRNLSHLRRRLARS